MSPADGIVEEIFVRANASDVAVVHPGGTLTYADLNAASASTAKRLGLSRACGLRVGLDCADGPDYIILSLAILRSGACLVPVPRELSRSEREVLKLTTAMEGIVVAEGSSSEAEFCLLEPIQPAWHKDFRELNAAFIRFSSGTTGKSKGVVLSHQSLRERIQAANRGLRITSGDRILWSLPMAHHFAVSIMLYLYHGATTVLSSNHLGAGLLNDARRAEATVFYGSPFHLRLLAEESSTLDWPSLRLAVSTASALTEQTAALFAERYGVLPSQGLGVIEVGLPCLNLSPTPENATSIGLPLPDYSVRLVDQEGAEAPTGAVGTLQLRGPGFFDAYLSPWKVRSELLAEGWFETGDLAFKDETGSIFLRGRAGTVINVGGMKCFPEEVETVLNGIAGVRESRVFSRPHPVFGAVPVAEIVVSDPATPPDSLSILRHCREHLSRYKIPVEVKAVASLRRTPTGKIRRT